MCFVPVAGGGQPPAVLNSHNTPASQVREAVLDLCIRNGIGEPRAERHSQSALRAIGVDDENTYWVTTPPRRPPPAAWGPPARRPAVPHPDLYQLSEWGRPSIVWRLWCPTTCVSCRPRSAYPEKVAAAGGARGGQGKGRKRKASSRRSSAQVQPGPASITPRLATSPGKSGYRHKRRTCEVEKLLCDTLR
ncbi:uncharacterized protein LOC127751977, partial [Frankliniella occidentalis]|uniref:Uncharacterized protein LOC127751977 n=1 Tax=Frankliniella occidentalis TaxID=133901 RepID=A0A9C6XAN4_FRAOC